MWMEYTAYQIHHPWIPARLHYITCHYGWLIIIWFHLMHTCTCVQCSVLPFIKCLIGKCSPPLLCHGCQSTILWLNSAFLFVVDSYLHNVYIQEGAMEALPRPGHLKWRLCFTQIYLSNFLLSRFFLEAIALFRHSWKYMPNTWL